MSIARQTGAAILLFVLALGIRIPQIRSGDLQLDEYHWVHRGREILVRLRERPHMATTHLGQPGVFPALIMASAQWLAEKRAFMRGAQISSIDRLLPSRLSMAIVASLVVPLAFLAGCWFVTPLVGFLAAMLLCFDPVHLGYSSMAHLDTAQASCVMGCIVCYQAALAWRRAWLKLLAGVFWGLSIVTKPTAASLILAFLLYRLVRSCAAGRQSSRQSEPLLQWSDIAAVGSGLLVFSLLYTRLWRHESDYLVRLGVKSGLADSLYSAGMWMQVNSLFSGLCIVGLLFCGVWSLLSKPRAIGTGWRFHFGATCLAVSFGLGAMLLVPQVLENQIRFWTWVSGLAHAAHKGYGHVLQPPVYGYVGLFASRLPELTLLGLLCGFAAWLGSFSKVSAGRQHESFNFIALLLLSITTWILPLSASSKQTWRYVLPVVPAIYMVAAFGLSSLLCALNKLRGFGKFVTPLGIFAAVALQVFILWSNYPHYHLFFNAISGGLKAAVERSSTIYGAGEERVVRYLAELVSKIPEAERPIYVKVAGDSEALEFAARYFLGPLGSQIKFGFYPRSVAEYLLTYPAMEQDIFGDNWADVRASVPEFSYAFKGVELLRLYKIPVPDYSEPLLMTASMSHHTTGKVVLVKQNNIKRKFLRAQLGRHEPGFIFFREGLRVMPGRYRMTAHLCPVVTKTANNSPYSSALLLEISELCAGSVTIERVLADEPGDVTLECDIPSAMRVEPRIQWFGQCSVCLHSVSWQKVGEEWVP